MGCPMLFGTAVRVTQQFPPELDGGFEHVCVDDCQKRLRTRSQLPGWHPESGWPSWLVAGINLRQGGPRLGPAFQKHRSGGFQLDFTIPFSDRPSARMKS